MGKKSQLPKGQMRLHKWINLAKMQAKQPAIPTSIPFFKLEEFANIVADKVASRLLTFLHQYTSGVRTDLVDMEISKTTIKTKIPKHTVLPNSLLKELVNELKENDLFKKRRELVENA